MISLRLITTGLDDVHSVIGYELGRMDKPTEYTLIQPREGSKYSYEAMHDINGISIPELRERGASREESLAILNHEMDFEDVLVWYKPFVSKFLKLENFNEVYTLIDLYALAKQKEFDPPSYKLGEVYEYTGTDNLFDLYDYLNTLPEPKRVRRV